MDSKREFNEASSKMLEGARETMTAGQEIASETMENVKAGVNQRKENLKKLASQAKETAADYANQAREYAKQAKDTTEDQIKSNPFWALAIALGIGLTMGLVLAPSRRED